MPPAGAQKTVLLVGASRGLGFAMVEEFLKRHYRVIATGRKASTDRLDQLAARSEGELEVEMVDITVPEEVAALRTRLVDRQIDVLFVNAGVKNDDSETVATVSTEEFIRVMVTNSLSPMRVIDAMEDLVPVSGTIGVMTSGQGSIANAANANYEVYRASKAALNMFMRTFEFRSADSPRTLLLMAPGWVKTDLGGPEARLTVEESIPKLVNTIEQHEGRPGIFYLDYLGKTVPW